MNEHLTVYQAAVLLALSPASPVHLAAVGIIPSRLYAGHRTIARRDLARWAASWGDKLNRAQVVTV